MHPHLFSPVWNRHEYISDIHVSFILNGLHGSWCLLLKSWRETIQFNHSLFLHGNVCCFENNCFFYFFPYRDLIENQFNQLYVNPAWYQCTKLISLFLDPSPCLYFSVGVYVTSKNTFMIYFNFTRMPLDIETIPLPFTESDPSKSWRGSRTSSCHSVSSVNSMSSSTSGWSSSSASGWSALSNSGMSR